jgi:hypothetical protein
MALEFRIGLKQEMVMKRKFSGVIAATLAVLFCLSAEAQETCLDEVMDGLNIDRAMHSEPARVLATIEIMGLDGFEHNEEIFADLLTGPVDLSGFISQVRTAVLNKQPAVEWFLCRALDEGLIVFENKLNERVETAIYTAVVLDRITNLMFDEVSFMMKIKEHYISKREIALGEERGTLAYWLGISEHVGGLFEIVKTATMDAVFSQYIAFRQREELTSLDLLKKNFGLKLNIIEAVLKDIRVGFDSNARVGWRLFNSPMRELYTEGSDNVMVQVFDEDWVPVYGSWNLAFMTGNLNDLHLLYPKLFIPSVVDAEDHYFLCNRGYSLWITVNMFLLRRIAGEEEVLLPNAQELAEVWGEVNLEFANESGFGAP